MSDALVLDFDDNMLLSELYGEHGKNLARIETALGVSIAERGNRVFVRGPDAARRRAERVLNTLYHRLEDGARVAAGDVDGVLKMSAPAFDTHNNVAPIRTHRREVRPRAPAQSAYVRALQKCELVFGIGPAGTGKTYLAVAAAAAAMAEGRVERIVLSRPAVEAGETLGFLPGDMRDKVDPYLRPLYDALYDLVPGTQVTRHLQTGAIEIAPLAFMRGRTLSNAFIILDEAQNATPMQMKMFLTRLGENSRMVITGDPSQTDLPDGGRSGLADALDILRDMRGVEIIRFGADDVVRHDMVGRIVAAYDRATPEENAP